MFSFKLTNYIMIKANLTLKYYFPLPRLVILVIMFGALSMEIDYVKHVDDIWLTLEVGNLVKSKNVKPLRDAII